jgi:hypothetical protein
VKLYGLVDPNVTHDGDIDSRVRLYSSAVRRGHLALPHDRRVDIELTPEQVRRLFPPPPPKFGEVAPIDTAPADGVLVLLYTEGDTVPQVAYRHTEGEAWMDYWAKRPVVGTPTGWGPLPWRRLNTEEEKEDGKAA